MMQLSPLYSPSIYLLNDLLLNAATHQLLRARLIFLPACHLPSAQSSLRHSTVPMIECVIITKTDGSILYSAHFGANQSMASVQETEETVYRLTNQNWNQAKGKNFDVASAEYVMEESHLHKPSGSV